MIIIISSAKTMDISSIELKQHSEPNFLDAAKFLLEECKKISQKQLSSIMKLNDKLAELTYNRFNNHDTANLKQALFIYDGDVFKQLEKNKYNEANLDFIQNHLLIMSGLYGALKPLDLIAPYRLEMGVKIAGGKFSNLYNFWTDKITQYLNQLLDKQKSQYVINLASTEYSKTINLSNLNYPMISIIFKQIRNKEPLSLGMLAKKARGQMLNFIIKNSIDNIEDLKKFNIDGYRYIPDLSDGLKLSFLTDKI